ncbi:transcription-repair coupling factor [Aerococcus urinae]|nr:transcription-repair coupling factor [Aerococcus urinae]
MEMNLENYLNEKIIDSKLKNTLRTGQSVLYLGLQAASKAYMIAEIQASHPDKKTVVLTNNLLQAERFYEDLQTFNPEADLHLYSSPESVAEDLAIQSPEALGDRLATLDWLLDEDSSGILISPIFGLKRALTPVSEWKHLVKNIQRGQELAVDQLKADLLLLGYERVEAVLRPGEMSVRGDIVDLFPLTSPQPLRLSLAFDEVDRITTFDVNSQKSQDDLEAVTILPAKDLLFSPARLKAGVAHLEKVAQEKAEKIQDEAIKKQVQAIFQDEIQAWSAGETTERTHYFSQILYPDSCSLLDYVGQGQTLVLDDMTRLIELSQEIDQRAALYLQGKVEAGHLPPIDQIYLDSHDQVMAYSGRKFYLAQWQKGYGNMRFDGLYQFQTRTVTPFYHNKEAIKLEFEAWLRMGRSLLIFIEEEDKARDLEKELKAMDFQAVLTQADQIIPEAINIIAGHLSGGIEFVDSQVVLLAQSDLFDQAKRRRRKNTNNLSNAERLKNYQELKPGDYVVHVNHGIGQFVGVETIEVAGNHKDYLSIVYADNASIHVPIDQIDLVQKYVSAEGKIPKLNKMGGTEWQKTKQRVSKKIEDIADDLVDLYAERETRKGYAFSPDNEDQAAFEDEFPYPETDDQLRSIQEIKADMEKEKPMDRLLVGDVGFGKTEVAMRAAFKAMLDGKQVAFLVPTTVLAQQHYETMLERFKDYPFTIDLLSRFRSPAEQKHVIKCLKEGSVQLVIGTHRLLSKDIKFLDLGLLVVDEEQRFGVKAKERLKALRKNVDVLTLTATPIPRTLNMSMMGVRDLSVIETPPANRFPVQTYVMEQNYGAIRDAIERELARNGQVFYLFNNVQNIQEKANFIEELVPQARVAIAHGQMHANQLEEVLMDFLAGDDDVLVTTTIIETGIDMPNVNTLLVEDADRMGLSTLYQLRGRVAYAYFMYRPDKALNEASEKRLTALKDFTELGAGFKIAMRDLSIRGAGNLLGQEQHGFVNSVGYDLFQQMLDEAIRKKQGKAAKRPQSPTEIELHIDAYIPSEYIQDENQKVEIYKRINLLDDVDTMWDLDDELLDRFGEPPVEVQWLLAVGTMKSYATAIGVEKITRKGKAIELVFTKQQDPSQLTPLIFQALEDIPMKLQIKMANDQLVMQLNTKDLSTDQWLDYLLQFLTQLSKDLQVDSDQVDGRQTRDGVE